VLLLVHHVSSMTANRIVLPNESNESNEIQDANRDPTLFSFLRRCVVADRSTIQFTPIYSIDYVRYPQKRSIYL